MNLGDTFILSSNFHNKSIGLILLFEDKKWLTFLPIFFKNNIFDNSTSCIFSSKINTNIVFSGLEFDECVGLMVINESKKKPSFLKEYCETNKPFINLIIDYTKIDFQGKSDDLNKFTLGGGTSFAGDKSLFDKIYIQALLQDEYTKMDISNILKTTA